MKNSEKGHLHSLMAGVRSELPIAVGVFPFGMIFGVLGVGAGLSPWQAQAMSWIVFAGSAQFVGAQLIGAGSPAAVLWLTTFVVNVRHMLYSTTLGPDMGHLRRGWRWLLAYLLTDEAFALTAVHYADKSIPLKYKHYFFLGAGLTLWVIWQISTAIGIFVGAELPTSWSLDFTLALTFIGIVIPTLADRAKGSIDRANIAAAASAAIVAVLTFSLPYKLGLVIAALTGIAVGTMMKSDAKQIKKDAL